MLLLIYGIVFTNWGPTDGPTDGRTDGPTDIASYRDAYAASKKEIVDQLGSFLTTFGVSE